MIPLSALALHAPTHRTAPLCSRLLPLVQVERVVVNFALPPYSSSCSSSAFLIITSLRSLLFNILIDLHHCPLPSQHITHDPAHHIASCTPPRHDSITAATQHKPARQQHVDGHLWTRFFSAPSPPPAPAPTAAVDPPALPPRCWARLHFQARVPFPPHHLPSPYTTLRCAVSCRVGTLAPELRTPHRVFLRLSHRPKSPAACSSTRQRTPVTTMGGFYIQYLESKLHDFPFPPRTST